MFRCIFDCARVWINFDYFYGCGEGRLRWLFFRFFWRIFWCVDFFLIILERNGIRWKCVKRVNSTFLLSAWESKQQKCARVSNDLRKKCNCSSDQRKSKSLGRSKIITARDQSSSSLDNVSFFDGSVPWASKGRKPISCKQRNRVMIDRNTDVLGFGYFLFFETWKVNLMINEWCGWILCYLEKGINEKKMNLG